jgi:hypothetical protein
LSNKKLISVHGMYMWHHLIYCKVPTYHVHGTAEIAEFPRLIPKVTQLFSNINFEGCLQSSWTHLITPSRNFVEVRWRSLCRSTSLGKRCTSYNASPTSRKRAADRWSLRNFLLRSSLFMFGKAQKSYRVRSELNSVFGLEKVDRCNPFRTSAIQSRSRPMRSGLFHLWKGSSEPRNFEMINGLQHVFKKWVERCKKCIACQGRYFGKETVTAPPQSSDSE